MSIRMTPKHQYVVDGQLTASVTSIINDGWPKNLMNWAARSVAEHVADAAPGSMDAMRIAAGRDGMVEALRVIPFSNRGKAAVKGTKVHHLAQGLVRGDAVEPPEELRGYVESAARFMDEWKVSPVLTETIVAHRGLRYAGQFDLVCDFVGKGIRALVDYKTSRSGIWPEIALQLAAYRHAQAYVVPGEMVDKYTEQPMRELGIDATYGVWVRDDGYDVYKVDTGPDVCAQFAAVRQVAAAKEASRRWVGPSIGVEDVTR